MSSLVIYLPCLYVTSSNLSVIAITFAVAQLQPSQLTRGAYDIRQSVN